MGRGSDENAIKEDRRDTAWAPEAVVFTTNDRGQGVTDRALGATLI